MERTLGSERPVIGNDISWPNMRGRSVALRQVTPSDYSFLYDVACGPEIGWRYRWRGGTPPPEAFPQLLWDGVLVQFVVERLRDGKAIGLVSAYAADLRNHWCHLSSIAHGDFAGTGAVLEGTAILVRYLSTVYEFRKIYFDALEFNYWQFASGQDRFFKVEGILRSHEFHGGRYWDLYKCAIYPNEVEEYLELL